MSDTPETDAEWEGNDVGLIFDRRIQAFCRRLERQRDAYAETLRLMAETDADWAFIRERHPEMGNSTALPPPVGSGEGSSA